MTEQQTKPKKSSMVQQSIEAARNAPALTPEMQAALDALVSASGAFEPLIVPRHGRCFAGFDDLILSMYARGMSVRDIRAHLTEMYHV